MEKKVQDNVEDASISAEELEARVKEAEALGKLMCMTDCEIVSVTK